MEAKLREYRALRRRKELIDKAKETIDQTKESLEQTKDKFIQKTKEKFVNFMKCDDIFAKMETPKEDEVVLIDNDLEPAGEKAAAEDTISDITSEVSEVESLAEEKQESWQYFMAKWTIYTVIWITLYIYTIQLEFGAVFFVFSFLFGIYFNTRTKPKKKGEVSAYSVFNENCKSIDGTLKAEQFEREIRYGAQSVR